MTLTDQKIDKTLATLRLEQVVEVTTESWLYKGEVDDCNQ
jgi:hypothetical protein